MNNETLLAKMTLQDLENKLPQNIFLRISRSIIVNITYVDSVDLKDNQIILKNEELLSISRRYKEQVLKRLNIIN